MSTTGALRLPPCLDWLRGSETGATWLETLPGLVISGQGGQPTILPWDFSGADDRSFSVDFKTPG